MRSRSLKTQCQIIKSALCSCVRDGWDNIKEKIKDFCQYWCHPLQHDLFIVIMIYVVSAMILLGACLLASTVSSEVIAVDTPVKMEEIKYPRDAAREGHHPSSYHSAIQDN